MNEVSNIQSVIQEPTLERQALPSGAVGSYNNLPVIANPKPTSVLAKLETIAEEATFVNRQGEKRQFRKGTLERKKQEALRRIGAAEKSYMQQVPDFDPSQVSDLELKFLSSKRPAPDEITRAVGHAYKDLTHQYIALRLFLQRSEENPELRSAIEAAKKKLLKEHGPEIRAGFNVTKDAIEFASGDLDKAQFARDFYRIQVLGFEKLSGTYEAIVKEYGATSFLPAVDYLLSALGSDLYSAKPSLSDIQLKPVIDDIRQLQTLRSVYDMAESTVSFLQRGHGVAAGVAPFELMDFILPLGYDSSFSDKSIEEMSSKLGLENDLQASISFVTSLSDLTRTLPQDIFRSQNDRQSMIEVVEGYSNYLFEREENEF